MGLAIHLHLLAAIAWIGGSIFMFMLGIFLVDKKAQEDVYPHVGPLFGYYEAVVLVVLVSSGLILASQHGLFELVFNGNNSEIIVNLEKKLTIVAIVTILTIIHFVIAIKTNGRSRTKRQQIISRGSSLLIFALNLLILHYAIVIRHIL